MIFEHEIPRGSKLYFGKSAQLKREIEHSSAMILSDAGYEEIVTPCFSYHQNASFGHNRLLVRINDRDNHEVSLRADSTADVLRIATKRLGRSSDVKRWFYIQPIFLFPTKEYYQVGAELLDGSFSEACSMSIKLLQKQNISPLLQIANIAIPKILNEKYGLNLEDIKAMNIDNLLNDAPDWVSSLIHVQKPEDLSDLSIYPDDIAKELQKLLDAVSTLEYENIVLSPMYYARMRYYDSLMFRAFEGNTMFATGGTYEIDETKAAGFALYVDKCVDRLLKEMGDE